MTQCLQRERTQSGDVNGSASIVVHLQRFFVYGEPGTGKTLLAQALLDMHKANF